MSVGSASAGVKSALAKDSDPYAAVTYKLNHPDAEVVCTDIKDFDFTPFKSHEQTVLFGGAPCQGFSTSNQRTRNSANQNNWLFQEFLRAVQEVQPDWVVFENVKGITETEGAKFLDFVKVGLRQEQYDVKSTILNARNFGVPQNRSRLFLVAGRNLEHFYFPKIGAADKVTVKDAISDLPYLQNGAGTDVLHYRSAPSSHYARKMRDGIEAVSGNLVTRNSPNIISRYKHIPQGGNWESIPAKLMENYKDTSNCHTGIYRHLEWDQPAVTIWNFRKNMLVHPSENRGLSIREAARLQSFPDSYHFVGSIGFQQQQVGNAVPPLLAKAVFEAIVRAGQANMQYKAAAE